jgi:hypothetical protein
MKILVISLAVGMQVIVTPVLGDGGDRDLRSFSPAQALAGCTGVDGV